MRLSNVLGSLVAAGTVKSQSSSIIPVIGLKTGIDPETLQPPARQNILDLQNGGPLWYDKESQLRPNGSKLSRDLYIQGLASFQKVPEDDETSYFRVSGGIFKIKLPSRRFGKLMLETAIHGRPYQPFNGVDQVPGAPLVGYCIHDEIIFSTWHRPYVVLFEVY